MKTELLARSLAPLAAALPSSDLEQVVELAVLVAHADLHIDDTEHELLRATMETLMRSKLAPVIVEAWITGARANIRAVGGEAYARRLGQVFAERGVGEAAYRAAALVALSSEGVSPAERGTLRALGEGAGLGEAAQAALDEALREELRAG